MTTHDAPIPMTPVRRRPARLRAALLATLLGSAFFATSIPARADDLAGPSRARPADRRAPGAAARRAPATPRPKGARDYQREKRYDFEGDMVDGELVRPEGDMGVARTEAKHGSMIRVRETFVGEIVKSAEDL